MSNVPYHPIVTEGDLKQKPSGCNITQPTNAHSGNQPSAAQIAAKGQDAYATYQAQNEAWRKATERRQSSAVKRRMLRPDEIK